MERCRFFVFTASRKQCTIEYSLGRQTGCLRKDPGMAEEYDVHAIMSALKTKEEMDPDQHDGCYELMRETIGAYGKIDDFSTLDYKDLNLVYLTTVGTWRQGIDSKKKTVYDSNLMPEDKESLIMLWDEVWEKAGRGEYTNYEMDAAGNRSIGLFGTGFYSFQKSTTDTHVQAFIKMCVDILPMTDDNAMYDRASEVLTVSFKGMKAASASMVLHCLKPSTFPVLNANMGNRNIFEVLGVEIVKKDSIETYVNNCRKIKAFRDKNFSYKNYRIFDMAAWKVKEFVISHPNGQYGPWEIMSVDVARLTLDKSSFPKQGAEILQEVCWFFHAEGLQSGRKQELVLLYDGVEFDGYIERESISPAKTELVWDSSLAEELDLLAEDGQQHTLEFRRDGENRYELELVEDKYVMPDTEKSDEEGWIPSLEEYDPGISAEQYESILRKGYTGHVVTLSTIYYLYKMGGSGTCAEVAYKYGGSPFKYVGHVNGVMRYVASESKCPIQKRTNSNGNRVWAVLFYGKPQEPGKLGSWAYKLREPLTKAIKSMEEDGFFDELTGKKQIMNNSFDHNLILYGPPGTGKTYHSVIYAVAICEGKELEEVKKEPYSNVMNRYRELKDEGRIAFTTFHQSYGYEEFIEGIKPKLDSENDLLGYTIEDGGFKAFCKRSGAVKVHTSDDFGLKANPHIWGMLLGGTGSTEIKQYCFDNNVIRFGWDHIADNDIIEDNSKFSKSDRFAMHQVSTFIYSMETGDIVIIAKNITTIDAIGVITGEYEYDHTKDTDSRTRSVKWLVKNVEFDIRPFLPNGRKQLPTSYLYPLDYLGTDNVSKILDELNDKTEVYFETETKPYVFIIDEINRGNISKIFGELITLIEETKRAGAPEAMEAILPYSGEAFSVPNNVYILGTMNTADRSIALMDTALRRRFEFAEMMPDSEVLDSLGVGTIAVGDDELNVAKMLDVINARIEYLFDREHTIGHAFFTKLADDPTIEILASIFEKNVIPLLQEYFYEDYEKIQLVLGDNSKEDEFKFILDRSVKVKDIFNGNPDIDLPEKGYSVQHEAFLKLESYKQIGKDL